jgi:hypothetical protein
LPSCDAFHLGDAVGDVVFLQAYRRPPAAAPAATQDAEAPPSDLARARRAMASGLHQMRSASRLLADAVADLRALARYDIEQT